MGAIGNLLDTLSSSAAWQIGTALLVLLAYPLYQAVYNAYFHPLSKFPGPRHWGASRIPFVYNLLSGSLVKRQRELHERYGPVFRMAPDEISFASEEAFNDIYSWRQGHKRAIRDPAFSVAPEGQADNLITTSNVKFHARVRGLLSHSFTEDSLHEQQSLIEGHADMFVHQFWRAATAKENAGKGALFNLTDWVNFFTMDVVSTLLYHFPYSCLQELTSKTSDRRPRLW